MALSTPIKVLLVGCVVVVVGCIVAFGVGGYFVHEWWGKTVRPKIESVQHGQEGYEKKTEQLSHQYPFTPPSDGIITEDQLVRFLKVREAIHTVFEKNKAEIDELGKKDQG